MAKSFTEDGAAGAGGPAQSTAPTPGAMSASSTPSTVPTTAPGQSGMLDYAAAGSGGGGGFTPTELPAASGASSASAGWPEGGLAPLASGGAPSTGAGGVPPSPMSGIFFDQGGGVPDADGDNDGDQNPGQGQSQNPGQGQSQNPGQDPMSAILQGALGSVDQVLQFGYKQYGLGGSQSGGVQDQEAQPQQQAANMPTVPASQSNSGVKPMQPMPGPLPPTNNPFGKRADAGGIQDDDQETS